MTELPAGTVTFLISDIVDSTRRWVEEDMTEVLATHDRLTQVAIESNEGVWVKHTGDGVIAAFHQPGPAVAAAVDIQRALATQDWEGEAIRVRIGIHTGEATPKEGDYFGLTVSSTARIADGAHPGQILVSSATKALIESGLNDETSFVELGEHRFKGLKSPITLFQVKAPTLESSFPPIDSLIRVEHNLPTHLTRFVGREQELAEVIEIVDSHRLTTLTGVGGAGKTRLSLEAAHALADDFKDGAWFVELAPVSDPEAVAPTLAAALRIRYEEGDAIDVEDRILEHLRTRELLLVFDNCEHVLRAVAALVTRILTACLKAKVIASSREGLGVSGERIWQTPSLGLGADSDAVALFYQRAEDSGVEIDRNGADLPHVERICALLDGMPLAIELAAARCRVLTPAQIKERLDDRFRLLTGGSSMALPRQQTLEAAVDWSYHLLTETEQALFDRLSVFQGGFSIEAVESVCTDDAIDAYAVLDTLASLVDKSMVTVRTVGSEARYSMLETLRQYAARKLLDRGMTDHWKDRHAHWFADQADVHSVQRTQDLGEYAWAEAEEANLRAALEWADRSGVELVTPIAETLARHALGNLGDPAEAVELYELALTHTEDGESERTADILAWLARSLGASGRVVDGVSVGDRAIDLALSNLDEDWSSRVLRTVGAWYAFAPEVEPSRALEIVEIAVRAARATDNKHTVHLALRGLAWSLVWAEGEYEQIEEVSREAIALAEGDVLAVQDAIAPRILAAMTRDSLKGTDLTSKVEDEILALADVHPTAGLDQWYAWTGIRRADWEIAERGLTELRGRLKGRHKLAFLVPAAAMAWMRGQLDLANLLLTEGHGLGRIGRWHHDFYPLWADTTACLGRLDRTQDIVSEHLDLTVQPIEEPMKLASLRALAQALVDIGEEREARETVSQMQQILSSAGGQMTGTPQLATPHASFLTAEAELTRLTGPDPDAWDKAGRTHIWEYWKLYCQARRAEALHRSGAPDAEDALRKAIERATAIDARWVLGWLNDLS